MKISVIQTGFFKLDGGAMFGVVPKRMWSKKHPPDENNMCTWSMRCLLVQLDNRNILIDTGIGNKQDAKFRSHFEPHGPYSLLGSLKEAGFSSESITDVFLTHLHFDHVGGAVSKSASGELVPTFPNATYWTNQQHFNWAMEPNPRERASFLKENFVPLQKAGVLQFIDVSEEDVDWLPGFSIRFVYGHTEAMMVPILELGDRKLYYCADVLPSSFHIGLPYIMSYDIRPLVSMEEKNRILNEAYEGGHQVFFEHDPKVAAGTIVKNERGRLVLGKEVEVFDVTH